MAEQPTHLDLLAYALGEAGDQPLNADQQRAVEMIQSTVSTLRGDALDPVPSTVVRDACDLASELPQAPTWFDRAVAVILNPLFDDRPQLALGLRGDDLRQCTFSAGDIRLDLEVTPATGDSGSLRDPDAKNLTHIRGQIDGEQELDAAVPVVVFIAGTSRVVRSTLTAKDGRFDLSLLPGEYELAFKLNNDVQSIGRIEVP